MKKILLILLPVLLLSSCTGNQVKVLVNSISMGGTGDNYSVSPAKVEVTSINMNGVVEIPITITNNDGQDNTYQLKVVEPLESELSQGYTAYPVKGIGTFFSQDTITIQGGKKGTVNFYIAKVDKIPDTQLWVNVSVESGQQITSAYIVNILIK